MKPNKGERRKENSRGENERRERVKRRERGEASAIVLTSGRQSEGFWMCREKRKGGKGRKREEHE